MHQKSHYNFANSILEKIFNEDLNKRGIELYIKRDDLIHSIVSGNKWRKLKHNVLQAKNENYKGILTFGGAFSNHLVATAAACNELGFLSIGIVRGDELNENSNDTLKMCSQLGMQFIFETRSNYFLRNEIPLQKKLKTDYPDYFLVPEGGSNYYGIKGCEEILKEIPFVPNHVFIAQGTTTTSCGILLSMNQQTTLHVVPVLKGFNSYSEMLNLLNLVTKNEEKSKALLNKVVFHSNYHFEGYGKCTDELREFIQNIKKNYLLPLDHVYTAKAFFALMDEIKDAKYNNKKIVFVHTGGLQGSSFWKT